MFDFIIVIFYYINNYLFDDLLTMIIKKLVNCISKKFIFSIKKIIHLNEDMANIKINIEIFNLYDLKYIFAFVHIQWC